jgi:glycosyltransferase A (GT-A) superfamily protein (DUF2064 family)
MECIVCNKILTEGLYREHLSKFCTATCAAWFGRAVANMIYLDGDDYRKIDNWLGEFMMVQKKRAAVAKRMSKRDVLDRARMEI